MRASQLTMFGVPSDPEARFHVFHDESGTYAPGVGDRWLLHGVLLVEARRQGAAFQTLQDIREEACYQGEIHYSTFRKAIRGPKGKCATGWLRAYARQLSDFCYYHCLAIDTRSPQFEPDRFGRPHHAYNRFALMAIEGAIAWSLKPYHRVGLSLYSDAKGRQQGDNFADYLPRQLGRHAADKHSSKPDAFPAVRLLQTEVTMVESDPAKVDAHLRVECEITQLVDLITGSTAQALTGASAARAKVALAEMVGGWIQDTRKVPWRQVERFHRRFSLSCFPDQDGGFYDPRLEGANRAQMNLFEDV